MSDSLWVHFISTQISVLAFELSIQFSNCYCWCCLQITETYIRKPLIVARERSRGRGSSLLFPIRRGDSRETCFRGAIFHLFWLWFYFWRRSARNISWTRVNFGGVSKRMRRYHLICSRRLEVATCLLKFEGIFWLLIWRKISIGNELNFSRARTAPWPSSGNYLVAAKKKFDATLLIERRERVQKGNKKKFGANTKIYNKKKFFLVSPIIWSLCETGQSVRLGR